MGSHSYPSGPTQVNTPRRNPAKGRMDGKNWTLFHDKDLYYFCTFLQHLYDIFFLIYICLYVSSYANLTMMTQ